MLSPVQDGQCLYVWYFSFIFVQRVKGEMVDKVPHFELISIICVIDGTGLKETSWQHFSLLIYLCIVIMHFALQDFCTGTFFKLRNVHSPAHRAMEETTYTGWSKVKIWSRDLMSCFHTLVGIPILRETSDVLVEVCALWLFLDTFSRAELSQHCPAFIEKCHSLTCNLQAFITKILLPVVLSIVIF